MTSYGRHDRKSSQTELQLFYGPLDIVQDYPGEPVPERKTNLDLLTN